MTTPTLAPSARRDFTDDLAILRDYTAELDTALAAQDGARAAVALATLRQAVHMIGLHVDPARETCAALTHAGGRYTLRPAAMLDDVSAADPADTTLPDADALPTLIAVPPQASELRGVCHPAVITSVASAAVRAGREPLLAAAHDVEQTLRCKLRDLAGPAQDRLQHRGRRTSTEACSCAPLAGGRHGRGCDLYDGWAE